MSKLRCHFWLFAIAACGGSSTMTPGIGGAGGNSQSGGEGVHARGGSAVAPLEGDGNVTSGDAGSIDGPQVAPPCAQLHNGKGANVRVLSAQGIHTSFNAMVGRLGQEIVFITWHIDSREVTAYDPVANSWRSIPLPTMGSPNELTLNPYLGIANGRLLVYGGRGYNFPRRILKSGGVLELSTGLWRSMSATRAPLLDPAPMRGQWIFERDGKAMIVAHLGDGIQASADAAAVYDSATDTWTTIPALPLDYLCDETPPVEGRLGVACAGYNGKVFLTNPAEVTRLPSVPGAGTFTKISLAWYGDELILDTSLNTIPWTARYEPGSKSYVRIQSPPIRPSTFGSGNNLQYVDKRLIALGEIQDQVSDEMVWAVYDRTADRWSGSICLPHLPIKRISNRFVVGDELFLFGPDVSSRPLLVALRFPQ